MTAGWRSRLGAIALAWLPFAVSAAAPDVAGVPEAQVVLLPGVPAQAVVGWVGRTPQVASRVDPTRAVFAPDPELVRLGKNLFNDPRLSRPRGMSCAACHDPGQAFGPRLATPRALAGPGTSEGSLPGRFGARTAPSLLYVRYVPRRHFYQDDDAPFASPFGGLFADGRADTLAEQVRGPLLDPREMNNGTPAQLLRSAQRSGLAAELAPRFGAAVQRDPEALLRALGAALQAFLQSDAMAPFSSRFDDYLRGQGTLSPAEQRGLALFRNPDKGNCASCHTMAETASRPERSLFTDFGYDAIAVPRNRRLADNRDPRHFDTGLDATARRLGWPEPGQWCAYLRTPGLRNVAVRQRFMHNAVFGDLRDAVAFYNTRSTDPAHWYASGLPFDDVPQACRGNVNVNSPPMNRRAGTTAALSDAEIDDLVAFLRSLTDKAYAGRMPPAR